MSDSSYLEHCVYYSGALGDNFSPLPGMRLLSKATSPGLQPETPEDVLWEDIESKVEHSCRKLALMWTASEMALEAERDYYSTTNRESPALYGEDAVAIQYHLEAFVLFARSSLDIAAYPFGLLLPRAIQQKRYDSFNDLLKAISKADTSLILVQKVAEWRADPNGWLSVIADTTRGRSLRDKLAHQTGFPLIYRQLNPPSEKERPVVRFDAQTEIPLETFVETLRMGVVNCYLYFESACLTGGME